jgi:translation initiation factor 2 gamma subunit (eIF-2gamma)
MNIITEFDSDNNFPIVPISAKKQTNLNNLYLEIANKIITLTGKGLKELRVKIDKYDKVLQWVKE